MPIYEYACRSCGHEFELFQRMGAEPPEACPVCNAPDVKKRISVTSFVLKGSGWYKDLYGLRSGGTSSYDSAAQKGSSSSSSSSSSSTSSSTATASPAAAPAAPSAAPTPNAK